MAEGQKTEYAALVTCGVILVLACMDVPVETVGMRGDSGILPRILYPLFHANFLHAFLNAWCFLSLVFAFHFRIRTIVTGWAVSSLFPSFLFVDIPWISGQVMQYTVGLSGICYFLIGMSSLMVRNRLMYNSCVAFYLVMGFIMPGFNGVLHLYCYLCGLIISSLNRPISWKR